MIMVKHLWGMGLAGLGAIALLPTLPAIAQITPDDTLGAERSQVIPNALVQGAPGVLIEGGARRGANLFQSFSDFNVGELQRVFFANPTGVESILGRVTGGNPSNILGTLGVAGSANLFLLNPSGIVFGPNARLDVRGSFVASTAAQWDLGNGQFFSAVNPNAAPLMDVAIRPGLQWGSGFQGAITNAGTLAVGDGQALMLAGQAVTSTGSLIAPGGTVQVLGDRVSLLDNAQVDVSGPGGGGTVLIGGDFQGSGGVPQASQTRVDANVRIAADAIGNGTGGRVIVWAKDHTQFAGTIRAQGGSSGGNGGFVEVSGKQTLSFTGRVDTTAPSGSLGTLLLDPFDLIIDAPEAAAISNATANVNLTADNNITFNTEIYNRNLGVGISAEAGNNIFVNSNIFTNTGNIRLFSTNGGVFINNASINPEAETASDRSAFIVVSGRDLVEIRNSELKNRQFNNSADSGNAILIVAREGSVLMDKVWLSTSNGGAGDAGVILITAQARVDILNSINPESVSLSPGLFSQGNQGGIVIGNDGTLEGLPTPKVIRISNSNLSTNNLSLGRAQADSGNIFLAASESILIENGSRIGANTGLPGTSANGIPGNAGKVTLQVPGNGSILVQGKSSISSSIYKQGEAGGVFLITGPDGSVSLVESDIFSNIENGGEGEGGVVRVTTGRLELRQGSQIQTIVRGAGDPGNELAGVGNAGVILIQAAEFVKLLGFEDSGDGTFFPSGLLSSVGTGAQGDSGVIFVETPLLFLSDRAAITASNFGSGVAGYILVVADFIVLDKRARLLAVARSGQGGSIGLQTPYLVGVSRNSVIATQVGATGRPGDGGDILIGADLDIDAAGRLQFSSSSPTLFVYGFPNNDTNILADAFRGRGGRIEIATISLRNLRQRPDIRITNDLDATSGVEGLDGTVNVSSFNLDIDRGLTPLPDRFQDPRVSEGCDPRTRQETSQFGTIGKGGATTQANSVLYRDTPLARVPDQPTVTSSTLTAELQPAQGWVVDAQGKIRLVANAATLTAPAPAHVLPVCPHP